MKKAQILIVTMIVASMALFSFKKAESGTSYGGSASVRINVVQVLKSNGERTTLSSPTLNATTSCTKSDAAAAKSELQRDLDRQADSKKSAVVWKPGADVVWEYAGDIDYRINTCN